MVSLPAMLLATLLPGSGETMLLEFTADWCGPCRTMQSTIRRLGDAGYPVQVVDVDRQPGIAHIAVAKTNHLVVRVVDAHIAVLVLHIFRPRIINN